MRTFWRSKHSTPLTAEPLIRRHSDPISPEQLLTASRTFPITARVDLQAALEKLFTERITATPIGVHVQYQHETLSIPHLLHTQNNPVVVGSLQHEEVDVGEAMLPVATNRLSGWRKRLSATSQCS